ncbi:MAG: RagB/SusD family nutrient uptake outer membrane protein [Bacteroidota bacterium]|nr:RagB/SusD family nutrient uptake outer membrane protein [Bacteroidota bacterium]
MKKLIHKILLGTISLLIVVSFSSCEKSLDVNPDPSFGLDPAEAIKSAEDMQKLLNSCYDACANMMNGQFQVISDLLADDVTSPLNNDGNTTAIFNRSVAQFNGATNSAYSQPYFTIYRVNVMDLYYDQVAFAQGEKERLQGEAAFLRALCHFETVKLWAQPAGFTPDNSHLGIIERTRAKNEVVLRSSVASNYSLIVSDLQKAISLLPISNGVFANRNAAKALLAKVYFTMGNYDAALPLLNEVIGAGYALSDSLNRFNRAEVESEIIFGFVTTNSAYDINTRGSGFKGSYRNDINIPTIGISAELYNLLSSDTTDRRSKFAGLINAGQVNEIKVSTKFNLNNFATPYLTLTDMLLMRSEIFALQSNPGSAILDLGLIVKRAYGETSAKYVSLSALSGQALIDEVRLQRRLEMHLEGDRIVQLKRMGAFHSPSTTIRNAPWNCPGMVLQFPASAGTVQGFIFNPEGGCN